MDRHSNVASSERRNGCDHGKKAIFQVFPISRNSEEMNRVLQIDNFHISPTPSNFVKLYQKYIYRLVAALVLNLAF